MCGASPGFCVAKNSPCRRVGLRHISLNYRCTRVAADLHDCQWSNVWRRRCHLFCGLPAEERPLALFAWRRDVASQAVCKALSILGQANKSRENEDPRITMT